jgi:serine phosphatase RsbU (regulator of sigma subunit)
VLDVLADQGRPLLGANSINISLLDDTGQQLQLVVSRRSSPQVKLQFSSYPAYGLYPTRDALAELRPVLIGSRRERDQRYPALAGLEADQVCWAVLPLVANGVALGTVGLGWASTQTFGDDEVRACGRIADLAAVALSRAQQFHAEHEARAAAEDLAHRLGVLQDLTGQLAAATDLATVGDLVVGAGLRALAADAATIGLLDDQTFTALATVGVPDDLVPRWSTHDVSDSSQIRDLLTRMRPVLVTSNKDRDARYPGHDPQDDRFEASATLALVSAGVPVGVVAYAWKDPRSFDQHVVDYLTAIASNAATAIDRCQPLTRSEQVAETLQRALLPTVTITMPGWDLTTCYTPAVEGTQVGGDWYDAFPTGDGRVVLALGDVTGKGIHAAAIMGAVRSALRAYATLDPTPGPMLTGMDDYFSAFKPDEMATCAVALLEPTTGQVTYASAGHLPPLLVGRARTQWLASATTLPLGALVPHREDAPRRRTQDVITVEPGEVLILYSDGLVERRDQDLQQSLELLATRAAGLADAPDLDTAATSLIEQLDAPHRVVDDIALLVLRRHLP